jgi:hypothetical protein
MGMAAVRHWTGKKTFSAAAPERASVCVET